MSEQTVSTEIVSIDDAQGGSKLGSQIVAIAKNNAPFYSSIKGNDLATKVKTLAAMNNAKPVSENLNKTIRLTDLIIQQVELNQRDQNGNIISDPATGEVKTDIAPRVVLIDESGEAFVSTSMGMFGACQQLLGVAGEPHLWGEAIEIHVVEAGVKPRKYYTIQYGPASK